MNPLFTIITPTVQRQSLLETCRSVDEQTLTDQWQHIVIVDSPVLDEELLAKIKHPQRLIVQCDKPHRNGGNTCRHNAWHFALGEYCWYVDDDNVVADPSTLQQIARKLDKLKDEQWTLWPIFRHGSIFFFDPPQPCFFDTGNAIVRREFAQWPNIDDYASDAIWLQQFKDKPYKAFPDALPIMIMEKTSFGEGGGINGQ